MNQDLTDYYNQRAEEYDKVYAIPEEQEDLQKATVIFQKLFANKNLMEIACGTGYWTEQLSQIAASVFATDINESVIEIAKVRKYPGNVSFAIADMHSLETEIRFVKPMKVTASVNFETEALSPDQTKVALINTGILPYPLNLMITMAENKFPKDMDVSLAMLKSKPEIKWPPFKIQHLTSEITQTP